MEHRFFGWVVREEHANGYYEHRAAASLKADYVNLTTAKAIIEAEKAESLRAGVQDPRVLPLPRKSVAQQQRDFREAKYGAVDKKWAETEYPLATADCIKANGDDDFWDDLLLSEADIGVGIQTAEQTVKAEDNDDFWGDLLLSEADIGVDIQKPEQTVKAEDNDDFWDDLLLSEADLGTPQSI
ncbi:hypothetical protein AAVH_21443 [Aphelenchoides avenae]|nr:hypothetical protein AAVH_21443 [Aphelenchus avenae]